MNTPNNFQKYRQHTICIGENHIAAVTSKGTVAAAGKNDCGQCDVGQWTDIVSVAAGYDFTAGLRSDGTVVFTKGTTLTQTAEAYQSELKNIVAITACLYNFAALKADGTVIAFGGLGIADQYMISDWENIVEISSNVNNITGLKADGTVEVAGLETEGYMYGQRNAREWTDIVSISCGYIFITGIKSDGTVVSTLKDKVEELSVTKDWSDITDITANQNIFGIKSDGTLMQAVYTDSELYFHDCSNIVETAIGRNLAAALKKDGTLLIAKRKGFNICAEAEKWHDLKVRPKLPPRKIVPKPSADSIEPEKTFAERYADTMLSNEKNIENYSLIKEHLRRPISAGDNHTVFIDPYGSVAAVGSNDYGQRNVRDWKNIISVSAGYDHSAGLRSDGTVAVAMCDRTFPIREVRMKKAHKWRDIISIASGSYHLLGLKLDGTVVSAGDNDIGECSVSEWSGIAAVAAGTEHSVGLKKDGTVIAAGSNKFGQCDVSDWKNIVAVAAGSFSTIGLRSDGTVVATGDLAPAVTSWKAIVDIDSGVSHIVGLQRDGSVMAAGSSCRHNECDISDWKDIISISAGSSHTVGIRYDGKIVSQGYNGEGQCTFRGKSASIYIYQGLLPELKKLAEKQNTPPSSGSSENKQQNNSSASGSSGCYIATCVYGSYDCPQVWTLRRFRDNTLSASRPGRAFIKAYYLISPTLVRIFGNSIIFKKVFRYILNKLINKLIKSGVSDPSRYYGD